MYKKKLWKPVLAGTLALAMALTPAVSGRSVSAAETEEMTTEAGNEEIATEEEAEATTEEASEETNDASTEATVEATDSTESEEVNTAGDIPLTAAYFPDANFRKYVSDKIDTDKNGVLSQAERAACVEIDIAGSSDKTGGYKDLTGIEYFTELKILQCNYNQLQGLDISKNTKLTELTCVKNQLKSLDVSKNTQLTFLNCSGNQLTSLDVSNNTLLTRLGCAVNQLKSLNVTNNTLLADLWCNGNQITSLDVRKNTQLGALDCCSNNLTSLDISKNIQLSDLRCGYNKLTSLDVTKNVKLFSLDCFGNQLTSLDVSKNTKLTALVCFSNQLKKLDISNNTDLDALHCSSNKLTSLDVSKNPVLRSLEINFNQLSSINVSKNPRLTNFKCIGNQFTSLDVSKNTKLEYLYCSSNKLTKLDVSNNTMLVGLYCDGNQLTGLDLSKNTKITTLNAQNNKYGVLPDGKLQIDLKTIPGLQVSKMTNINGGTLSGTILTFKKGVKNVTYDYNCGNGHSVTFTLTNDLTKAFCIRLYKLCLGREADESGVNHWSTQLDCGVATGASVGYGFVFSDEYKKKNTSDEAYVKMLYKVFMDREADKGGLNYWIDLLNQGMSREYVYKGFVESKEFTNICATYGIERGTIKLTQARDQNVNVTKFVNRIYVKAMNRKGDASGLNHWCNQILTKKMTPVQVAESFIYSKEFTDKNLSNTEYIKVLYRTFMGREADSAGLNYWLGRLNKGDSRKTVLKAFAGCQEFKNIVKSFGL